MVISVLSSLPLYMMLFLKIPTWVVDQIDKVMRSFFWKESGEISSCSCLVRWEEVCQPKESGGLGILYLKPVSYTHLTLPTKRIV